MEEPVNPPVLTSGGQDILQVPFYLLSSQDYLLDFDQNNDPFMTFDTSSSNNFTASTSYTPPTGFLFLTLNLDSTDSTAYPNLWGPNQLTDYYLSLNLQTQTYQVIGTNLDEVEAYDYRIQVYNILNRNARWSYTHLSGTSYYILAPNGSTHIPVSPAA